MIQSTSFIKKPAIPLLAWISLLILSLVFAAERVSFTDSAWQFFQKLNSESFVFPQDRYGIFWMAIPSWIGIRLGLPLSSQIYLFSAGYIAMYFLLWWICFYPLKNPKAAWLVLLSVILGTRQSFVHPISETHEALAFGALFWAILESDFKPWTKYFFSLAVLANTMLIHPIAVFVLGFVLLSNWLLSPKPNKPLLFSLLAGLVAWSFTRFLYSSGNYDAGQYALLKNIQPSDLIPWKWVSLKFLATRSYYLYWPTGILAGWTLLTWWKQGKKMEIFILFGAITAYTLLAIITFRTGDSDYMMEKNFLPSVFMVSLLFLHTLFADSESNLGKNWLIMVCLAGIFICWRGISIFSTRLQAIDSLIELSMKQGHSKSYVLERDLDSKTYLVTWGLGVETYLRALTKYQQNVSIFIQNDSLPPLKSSDFRAVPWQSYNNNQLNPSFFPHDTASYYRLNIPLQNRNQ